MNDIAAAWLAAALASSRRTTGTDYAKVSPDGADHWMTLLA
jgi:hypothetical protein